MDKANFEIVGNVGKSGKLATSERWKTDDGTQKDRTYWHRVTVFAPASIAWSEWDRRLRKWHKVIWI